MMQVVIYTSLNVIYDEKGQCVSKGLPGCDPIIYRYDKGNIPVLPYCRPQSVSYYDDYLFMDDLVTSDTKRVLSCDTLSNYGIPVIGTDKSKGFLTGTAVYSLTAPASKTVSSFYYDYQGRMIQSHRKEAVGGYGHIHRSLTFTGKPSRTRETVELPDGQVDSLVTVRAYDGQERLVSETTSLNDKSQSVSYGYDEIGRLTSRVYGTEANPSALTETLAYNIRDQLTDQNSNVFNMSLRYQEPTLGAVPKYNGSVSEWEWNHGVGTETNAWSLSYDGVGRLTDAQRFVGGVQTNSFSERSITYDRNSNALTLTRYGENAATPEERLAYSYDGNLLSGISNTGASGGGDQYTHDANGNMTHEGLSGLDIVYNEQNLTRRISSGGTTLAEYEYLADGTKLRALDGGGNGYQYRGSLIYTQTAGQTGSPAITLDCDVTSAGRIVRENTADGSSTYKVQHYLRDHLGSVRAVIDGDTGTVIEASDYYQFGKRIQVTAPVSEPVEGAQHAAEPAVAPVATATSVASTSSPNRWRFSGKEDQSFLGASIPLLDFGARMYDPTTARWTAIDPMAEDYHGVSPYAYCLGNPISIIDPNGRWITLYYNGHEYRYQDGQFLQYQTEGNNAGSYVPTSDAQVQSLGGMLTELSKVKTGKSLIDYFSNDENNAYIQFDEGNNVIDLSGVSSTIYLNKDFIGETVPTEAGMQQMPFWLVVGHELSHRVDYLKRRNEVSKIWIEEENVKIKNTEIQATHYENLMREEANLPLRTHYATISAGRNVMPYEPSRLINKKGRSIVLPNVYYTPIRKRK